jgi:leucyl aminopeptidase (aminopeptidase T)
VPQYLEWELYHAAYKLVTDMLALKPGEAVVITADTESDQRVVDITAGAAYHVGAKPLSVWVVASPFGVGKLTDPVVPVEALSSLLANADAWVEFNYKWLLYSTVHERAMELNRRLRHLCLVGMNVDMMVRLIGRVDLKVLREFQDTLADMLRRTRHIRITTPAGTDVEFERLPESPVLNNKGEAFTPGSHMLPGQISLAPKFDTVNGVIVFDGSVYPPIGLLEEPIRLYVRDGEIVKIEGGKEAVEFEKWLRSFNHPQMLRVAHLSFGLHPEAKLTGNILEDERIWGATEWGIGYVSRRLTGSAPIEAPSHTDGVCLNSSVWLDGMQILDRGKFVEPRLAELAKKLGK